MKDGVSVSRGSKDIPAFLKFSTVFQAIAHIWCYMIFPLGLIYYWWDPDPQGYFFIGVFFFCCACVVAQQGPTSQYINNTKEFGDCVETLSHAIQSPPAIRYIVQNYHYERRSSGSGRNRKTRTVRVDTRRDEMVFMYETWVDESDPVSSIGMLQMMKLTRFKVNK